MNRLSALLLTTLALVAALLVAAPAHASVAPPTARTSYDSWGDYKANTRARLQVGYGSLQRGGKIQYQRKAKGHARTQVGYRVRPVDGGGQPIGDFDYGKWLPIKPGQTLVRRGPDVACYPAINEIQAVVRIKVDGAWSRPKKLTDLVASALSACQ